MSSRLVSYISRAIVEEVCRDGEFCVTHACPHFVETSTSHPYQEGNALEYHTECTLQRAYPFQPRNCPGFKPYVEDIMSDLSNEAGL